jgi:predicted dehydrogenase
MELEDGAEVDLDVSWCKAGMQNLQLGLKAVGSRGHLVVDGDRLDADLAEGRLSLEAYDLPDHTRFLLAGEGYCAEIEDFLDSIDSARLPDVTWELGCEVQRIIQALYRSGNTGHSALLDELGV